jgi:hypothetical protein
MNKEQGTRNDEQGTRNDEQGMMKLNFEGEKFNLTPMFVSSI